MSHGFSGHLSAILLALLVLQRICWCRGDIPITETDIRALKPEAKPYKRADGDGLNLKVNPDGSKLCGWLIGMKVSRNCSLVGDITAALTERPPFQHRAAMPRGELPTFFGKLDAEPLVPLAPCCLDAGKLLSLGFSGPHLFPGTRQGAMSENTILYALYRLGNHKKATIHGFRGTGSTILNETGKFKLDWIER